MSEPATTVRRVLVMATPSTAPELEAALSRMGIEVQTLTANPSLPLSDGGLPDLIWLEHDPPVLDGLGILEQLRSTPAGLALPVVMFARVWDMLALYRAAQAHVSSCLQWPSTNRASWLLEIAHYWTSINEPAA